MPLKESASSDPSVEPARRRWLGLWVMMLAMVMDLIDVAIVSLALPSIQADLNASPAALEWIVAGYPLTFGVMLVTGGRMGDALGRRRMFLWGVAGFIVASALCGLAPNAEVLIVSRLAQGVFAGLMTPQILSMIQVAFTPDERPKAYAIFGAASGIAQVSGPLVGGLLIEADLFGYGWRAIFLINLPIGILTLIASVILLRESKSEEAQRFDFPGVGLLTLALLLVLYPLIQGRELGWPLWAFVMLATAVPAFALFAWYQGRRDRRMATPLVPPRLFKQRAFTGGLLTGITFFIGVTGFLVVLAITLQTGLGFSALHAGLSLLPYALGIAAAAGASFGLVPKLGRLLIVIGALIKAVGMAVLMVMVTGAGEGLTSWHLVPGLLIAGIGMGLVSPTIADIVLVGVRSEDAGAASGILITAGQLGAAIGVALIGVVYFGTLSAGSYLGAFGNALLFQIAVFVLSALLALLVPKPAPGARVEPGAHAF
ncbi:MFS transporter [Nonomuraea jiangxiensis]|uniref:Drug resistance transporter, EmrB/QacA subfamily n=1 Tax=Nonomuraea jiangxiensis TaxID=633440 RepID=A0A1G8RWS4_9ACTN|nr:MFS transporter [Nonomuraea jiangxiensis]SDJ21376.1 drug resistance transporter, EmrB/QacA subfamily [Nonomuraea jiangxiensis]